MPFEWRVFELAKEPEHPDQNQDAWWLNAEDGVAAIADGVTSGIFSRQWARLLTRAVVDDWPDPGNEDRFPAWVSDLRAQWEREIDVSGLAWYQRAKLREGGFSTLLWLRLLDNGGLRDGREESRIEALAIGDSCLFHVRGDELLESFPLDCTGQFDSSPLVLGSVNLKRDDQLQFERLEIASRTGDMIVLCTDSVAAWAMNQYERGDPVPWSNYWDMEPQAWADEVGRLRGQSRMRVDDATLLLLRVSQTAGPPAEQYTAPAIQVPEINVPGDAPEVDLLAVDDWGVPAISDEDPPESTPPDEATCSFSDSVTETYPVADTYAIQMPVPGPEPQAKPGLPALPPQAGPPSPPPPLPPMPGAPPQGPPADWRDHVNLFSERLFKKVSEGLSRGVDKLQEAKESAVKKLREKTEGKRQDDDVP